MPIALLHNGVVFLFTFREVLKNYPHNFGLHKGGLKHNLNVEFWKNAD